MLMYIYRYGKKRNFLIMQERKCFSISVFVAVRATSGGTRHLKLRKKKLAWKITHV